MSPNTQITQTTNDSDTTAVQDSNETPIDPSTARTWTTELFYQVIFNLARNPPFKTLLQRHRPVSTVPVQLPPTSQQHLKGKW